jgi:hypothetical protein
MFAKVRQPQSAAFVGARRRKINDEIKSPREGTVET